MDNDRGFSFVCIVYQTCEMIIYFKYKIEFATNITEVEGNAVQISNNKNSVVKDLFRFI